MTKTPIKIFLIFAAAFAAGGGACYQVKETPEHRLNAAKYVLPVCRVAEKIEAGKCRFDVACRFSTTYIKMDYRLEPPATFTFDGQPFDEKLALNTACSYKTSAFVFTDAAGNTRRDEQNFQKAGLAESVVKIDRQSDLTMQLKDVAYPNDTEFRLVFAGRNAEGQNLEFFTVPTDAKNIENLSEYNRKNLTLTIPAEILKNISGKPSKVFLEVTVKLQKTHPGYAERSTALTYTYQTNSASLKWE
ncbi:MAG: hypothetical protein ACR2L1_11290 [Pyrinomonadaceae bacterium]